MKIIGNVEEMKWIKEALMNQCSLCPYMKACNQAANEEQQCFGEVQHTCRAYLESRIEFVEENA